MHNVMKYVKYAEYGSTLYLHNLGLWLCAAVEICKILLVLHNILYVCGSMPQCPAASGCPSSDCVASIDPGSSPVDSSSGDKVVARCKTIFFKTIHFLGVYIHWMPLQRIYN